MNAYRYRADGRALDVLAETTHQGAEFVGALTGASLVELIGAVDVHAIEAGPARELVPHEWDGFGVHDPARCDTCEMLGCVAWEFSGPFAEWLDSPAGRFAEWLAAGGRVTS